jgi:hypothetical protein
MSEFRIFSVPNEDEYLAAVVKLAAAAESFGGMKEYLREYEFLGSSDQSEIARRHIRAAGEIALRLEPKSKEGVVADRMFMTITHSFKRGLITGTQLTDIVHDEYVPDLLVLHRLDKGIRRNIGEDKDDFVDGLGMLTWGQMGLELMGEEAVSFLDDLANDVAELPEHRSLYKLAAGAAVLTAYSLIVDQNITSVTRYFSQNDLSKELRELTDSTTGE